MCEKSETILRFSNKNFSYSEYSCSCSCSAASSKADVLVSGSPPCTCAGTCVRRDGDARAYIYAYACGGCYGRANPTSANCPVPTARSMLQTEPVDCTCMGRGTWRSRGPSCSRPRSGFIGFPPGVATLFLLCPNRMLLTVAGLRQLLFLVAVACAAASGGDI
jgi:hypothetical protein